MKRILLLSFKKTRANLLTANRSKEAQKWGKNAGNTLPGVK